MSTRGRCRQSREFLRGDSGFSVSRSGGREQYSVKFICSASGIGSLQRGSKGYREEWEREVVRIKLS